MIGGIMAYILQKGDNYCYIGDNNAVCKTKERELASKFVNSGDAYALLNRATKKLKGYQVIDLQTNKQVKNKSKSKRKTFPANERVAVYSKGKGKCAICGKFVSFDDFTIDHIIPLAEGGTNKIENLQCTCKSCNSLKQNLLPDDLMKKLTEIVLYQMRINYDESFWRKINGIRRNRRKRKIYRRARKIMELVRNFIEVMKRILERIKY